METLGLMSFEIIAFLAKTVIIVLSIILVIKTIFEGARAEQSSDLKVTHLNEKYKRQKIDLKYLLMTPEMRLFAEKKQIREEKSAAKKKKKIAKKEFKSDQKKESQVQVDTDQASDSLDAVITESNYDQTDDKRRLFVLSFKGDIQASAVESLRREITAIIQIAQPEDEVLLRLNNSGGYVHTHGLAASQLTRITKAGYKLTISIDQVAASGGYMMACVGHNILAAPFAIIGSIGVVAQVPNVHRLLKKHEIDVELHTAGQFKRTLTLLGENTEEGREKFIEDLHKTHDLFQDFVRSQREKVNVEEVATGETWYGSSALEVGLVDEVKTSDEFILECLTHYEIFSLEHQRKKRVSEKALSLVHNLLGGRLPEV
jgi:serine protease SohB